MTIAPSAAAPAADSLLASLDSEQRAAATLPDGPAQVIAPAGSGKTTTLIARLGVLLGRGVAADRIGVVTFNRDAAAELAARIANRLAPDVPDAKTIEVRTLHAMARQVLLDAGCPVRLLPDRLPLLRAARRRALAALPIVADGTDPPPQPPDPSALDTIVSAWKVEGRAPPPEAAGVVDAFAALLAIRGHIDFDDLVVGAVAALEEDAELRRRWQARFSHLCVDEFQDVDAAQLRLVRILAAPEDNLFVVGDDDQTIYAWRLADVRRILSFESLYPGTRRVQLATNYRCPAPVVTASRRLIEVNQERFAKRIRPAPNAPELDAVAAYPTTAPDWPDRLATVAAREAEGGRTICFLARTRAEVGPMLLALTRAGVPHATSVPAPLQAEPVRTMVDGARTFPGHVAPFQALLTLRAARGWRRGDAADTLSDDDHAALDALLGWAAAYPTLDRFLEDEAKALARLEALRRPNSPVEVATVHGAKGREWQTVVVLGMEEDRFPSRRALIGAEDPARALEEERRLAYVALTRATMRLVLAYDPARASRFLVESGLVPRGQPQARSA
jgi:DNA helicase-2/ATP-dependent DNA helicase PcrA